MLKTRLLLLLLTLFLLVPAYSEPLHIVAAENFYGQIAATLGGKYVQVESIISHPNQDPHLFSTRPATAKSIAHAELIIYNGLDYDAWMEKLITAAPQKKIILNVGDLNHKKQGDNPHIWYDPTVMRVYAEQLTAQLSRIDPAHQSYFHEQLAQFMYHYQRLKKQIDTDKAIFQDTPVIATEPVFNDMAKALGLKMLGQGFQLSVMNGTEPSVKDIKAFEDHLMHHTVKVLIMNNQVSDPLTKRMQETAQRADIPCVGVSELQPPGQDYFTWMSSQLITLEKALGG